MSQPTSPTSNNEINLPTCKYINLISARKDKAISAVETAHAERTTVNAMKTKEAEHESCQTMINAFETMIGDLVESEYNEWSSVTNKKYPERILYNGSHVAEANSITIKVYAEKQDIISAAKQYIKFVNDRYKTISEELELSHERSNDFEEQLEYAIADQDDTDKILTEKDTQISNLEKKINKAYKTTPRFMLLAIFYSYMIGALGVINVIYNHLWVVGMCFYVTGSMIQIFFETGATATHMIINNTHSFCTLVFPNPMQ